MTTLFSSKHIVAVLQKRGFVYVSQKGSHVKFRCVTPAGIVYTVIVPANKNEIPFGTFRSIVRQAGLQVSDFESKK
jgi:predicted RNA binding protein YcfA (HicA-like mRNA interferase family)